MDAQEASAKFREADGLFRAGRFAEALEVLVALDAAFPNTKNILYPLAMCLQKVGRFDEAEAICDRLFAEFEDARGQALKAEIQAARVMADGDPALAGLDANLLDDILEPRPKKPAPARPAASGLSMPRYVMIGVAVVVVVGALAALGVVGNKKGWLKFSRETVESVEAKLLDQWSNANSYTGTLHVSSTQAPMPANGSGVIEYMTKDGKPLCRLEGVVSAKMGPAPMDVTLLLVSDGSDFHIQVDMMGKPMVIKMPLPPTPQFSPEAMKSMFDELHKAFDAKLLPTELVDGLPSYVIQLTPKPGTPAAAPIPGMPAQFGNMKLYFTKDTMSQVKMVLSDKSGAALATLALKDIKLNADLKPERFKYTPPSGVPVMGMADIQKMMPMMMMGR